jgi:iron complex outermembrane recepter protein
MNFKPARYAANASYRKIATAIIAISAIIPHAVKAQDSSKFDLPTDAVEGTSVDTIVVSALRAKSTATRVDAEVRDLPQTITLIPRELLDDLVVTRLEDIAYTTVGVIPITPFLGGQSLGFFIRGFAGGSVLVDGFNTGVTFGQSQAIIDPAIAERVEILRGPASILYGQGNPGGVVNITTKRPLDEFGITAEGMLSTDEMRRATLDITGPLDGGFSARLNAVYENSGSFRDFVKNKRILAAPSLRFSPSDDLTVNLDYVFDRFDFTVDRAGGSFPEIYENIPRSRNLSEPWIPLNKNTTHTVRGVMEYRFAPAWRARLSGSYYKSSTPGAAEIGFFPGPIEGTTTIGRYYQVSTDKSSDRTVSGQILGNFETGPLSHNVILSYENVSAYYSYLALGGTVGDIDIFNPIYSAGPLTQATELSYQGANFTDYQAVYGQNLISIGEKWKLLVGLRWDEVNSGFYNDAAQTDLFSTQRNDRITPRAGLIFRPVEPTTLFLSWSQGFLANIGTNRLGEIFDPEESESFEAGIKQELIGRRVSATFNMFQITKRNLLLSDPEDFNFFVNAGKVRSRGFEFEFDGRIRPNWTLRAGLAYVDAKVIDSIDPASLPEGDSLPGNSPWNFNVNTRYEINSGALSGFRFGGNLSNASKRASRIPNPARALPSYTRIDVFAGYTVGKFDLQINLENLFDERILMTNGNGLIQFDQPRRIVFTLRSALGSLVR